MTPEQIFRSKVPWVIASLLRDFPEWGVEDAAAVCGNGGHESRGLQAINEDKPVVAGSRGGFSWFQWTGPRRKQFEAYAKRIGCDVASDEAAYKFLVYELRGPEKAAIEKTRAAKGLNAKVKAFELAYERAGAKHYPSRNKWARIALDEWHNSEYAPATRVPPWNRPAGLPVTPAPVAQPYSEALIRQVQQRLRDLGYPEVGQVDGKLGTKTIGAILAFQADNSLPLSPVVDLALIEALRKALPRPLDPARTKATAADLKDATSVKLGQAVKVGGIVTSIAGAAGGVLDGTTDVEGLISDVDRVRSVWAAVASLSPWLLLAVGGAAATYLGYRFVSEQVQAYRENRHT